VIWEQELDTEVTALVEVDDGEWLRFPQQIAQDGRAFVPIVGMPFDHPVSVRLETQHEDELIQSELLEYQTGTQQVFIPDLELTGDPADAPGFVFASVLQADSTLLTIIDAHGRTVWATEVDALVVRVERDPSGLGVIANTTIDRIDESAHLLYFDWEGNLREEVEVLDAHTDFATTDDGVVFLPRWELRTIGEGTDARTVVGDTVVAVSPDGEERTVWSAWEEWDFPEEVNFSNGFYLGDSTVEDWTHLNHIAYDADRDEVLLSFAHLDMVAAVAADGSGLVWSLSTVNESTLIPAGEVALKLPHSLYAVGNGEYVVFNQMTPGTDCSGANSFAVDLEAKTATELWSFSGTDCLSVYYLGQARPIEEGRTLVTWSTSGRLEQRDSSGASAWSAQLSLGSGFGYSDHALIPTLSASGM